MITIYPNTYADTLLRILATAGEFPAQSLSLIGNERTVKALVHKLESPQQLRFPNGNEYHARLLSVSGWGEKRTVRFHKNGLALLRELHPDALDCYLNGFYQHHFPGGIRHILRHHRIAEVIAMMQLSGIDYAPYLLPPLQSEGRGTTAITQAQFYPSRQIKRIDTQEMNKTIFTRVTGLFLSPGGAYAVYNTRSGAMRWMDKGEFKTRLFYTELCMANTALSDMDSALLFGSDGEAALSTMINSEAKMKRPQPFSNIYTHVHFIPLDQNGQRLLRILSTVDWRTKILAGLFTEDDIASASGYFGCDAKVDGQFVLSFLDGDLAKLIPFQSRDPTDGYQYMVICYPWQAPFLRRIIGQEVQLQMLDMSTVEEVVQRE